ncbi:MAG: acyl-CoA synthetase [Rhodospirillales bacterium]
MTDIYCPDHHAATDPDRLAYCLCDSGETVSFGQLTARSNQGAHLLRGEGVETGQHILILMENRREFLEVCFAADRAGVYYTTVSTQLKLDEIVYIARDCGARVLVLSDHFAPLAEALRKALGDGCKLFMVGEPSPGYESWTTRADGLPEAPIADPAQGLDMLYSSGTTGRPKGIKWPLPGGRQGESTMLIDLLTDLFGYGRETRYLNPAPLYHAAPLRHAMVTIKAGGCVFVMKKFDAEAALAIIEAEKITHSQWVPTMFVRMLKLPETVRRRYDVSSLRMAVHAAAPCPQDVKRKMIDWWGPIVHEYYAGTENNGFCAITSEEWLAHPGSVGRAKLGRLHICDAEGEELPLGAEGEVYFSEGHSFVYHNDPEKTAASRNAAGWTTLGDIGRLDAEGYLYLTDRKSFVINSGGVNIYPQEAENILIGHPSVVDAAVIGIPNEDFGEEVKAVVQLTDSAEASPDLERALIDYCAERIARFKCPRSVDFRQTLPREPTGKLMKRLLRDEYRKPARS